MSKAKVCATAAILLGLAGCESANGLISDPAPPWQQSYRDRAQQAEAERRQERVAEQIVSGNMEIAQREFHNHYEGKLPDANLTMKREQVGNSINLLMDWTSPRVTFLPGVFDIIKSTPEDGRDVAAFSTLVASTINRMDAQLRQNHISYRIVADYTGAADSIPVSRSSVYSGALGAFTLPATATTVDGQHAEVSLQPGDHLTNVGLAALRAWSMRNLIHDLTGSVQLQDQFTLSVSNAAGATHRYAQISIHLVPATNNPAVSSIDFRTSGS